MRKLFLLAIVPLLVSCSIKKVDLIVHHATIYTVDSAFSVAQAMAINDGKIVALGTNEEIMKNFSAREAVDAEGQIIYPGFIDAHSHFTGYGKNLFEANLFGTNSWNDVLQRLTDFEQKQHDTSWVIGRGWDQNKWTVKEFPTNERLTLMFPNRPVILTRVDGHAAIANDRALALAGIYPGQMITGGEIEVKNGKLTGILIDNAVDLVGKVIPKPTKEDYTKWLAAAEKNCFAQGLTTVSDCGIMYNVAETIDELQKDGKLNMRLYVMLSDAKQNYDKYLSKGPYKTDKLFIKGFKLYGDGALGSRGACLLEPYSDKPGWSGFLLSNPSHFDSVANILSKTEFQMCTHAIGDSGNRAILNIYGKYLKGKNDKRWRIEHAQVVNQNDFKLFGLNSIVPSVQPTHATSDMYWAGDRLGNERLKGAYAFKQLLQQNGWIPLGTDFPVEDISPFKTFLAAVVRKDASGFPANGFQMENALTREEAIRGMTIWAAKAGFLENEIGSLQVGKKADFIILDKDLMKVDEKEILNVKVQGTFINGKKVYSVQN
jgi:predicted amidohydrolase YtcJ